MKTEEFVEIYNNEKLSDIFDTICDFFSKPLPQDFVKHYDVGEVIMDIFGHDQTSKNFDRVLKFLDIIKSNQPDFYYKYFQYLDKFLVNYYCFHLDKSKVSQSFENFIGDPLQGIDQYLLTFKKILFYQHTELLDKAVTNNFQIIRDADGLIGFAELDLAICKLFMILQEIYKEKNESLDRASFSSVISEFNFTLDDEQLSYIEMGILKPRIEADTLKEMLIKDKDNTLFVFCGYFFRYMFEKGFEFYLSVRIWDKMQIYWKENNESSRSVDEFFKIDEELFEKLLADYSGDLIVNNKPEMIAILWGSVYVYDFLHQYDLISENIFKDFLTVSRRLKAKVITLFTSELWDSNFVHYWEKPDCISEAEFSEENKIFRKSISFKQQYFSELKSEISDELSKIGELSDFILQADEDERMKFYQNPEKEKVGRNEPCPCGSGKKYKKCCGK
jgi:hypothetical protein